MSFKTCLFLWCLLFSPGRSCLQLVPGTQLWPWAAPISLFLWEPFGSELTRGKNGISRSYGRCRADKVSGFGKVTEAGWLWAVTSLL